MRELENEQILNKIKAVPCKMGRRLVGTFGEYRRSWEKEVKEKRQRQ